MGLWGDLLQEQDYFNGIELMIVLPETFQLSPLRGGAGHAYDDTSELWRMLTSVLLYPQNPPDQLPYERIELGL